MLEKKTLNKLLHNSGLMFNKAFNHLFSVVHDQNTSSKELNNENNQWKMSFNPDPLKEAQEVNFSSKMTKNQSPNINF